MKTMKLLSKALLVSAVIASIGDAQGPAVQARLGAPEPMMGHFPNLKLHKHRLCPPSLEAPTAPSTMDPPSTPSSTPDFSAAGEYKGSGGRTASVLAGTGIGGAVTGDPILTALYTPLILPGLFTTAGGQSAVPSDRIYFDYGYFHRVSARGVGTSAPVLVRVPDTQPSSGPSSFPGPTGTISSVTQSPNPVAAFNLHTFNLGIEKTFFDGLASAYVSVPFLHATENLSGQRINGLGNVNAGFKVILFQNQLTGNTWTAGFTASFPTAHAAVAQSYVQSENGDGDLLLQSTSVSINPTYLQPWFAGLLIFDRVFVHEYFGIVIPTDSQVATFLNNDVTIGYQLYRAANGGTLRSVTPIVGVHALIPLCRRGTPAGQGTTTFVPFNSDESFPVPPAPTSFGFTDQVFVSGGAQFGIGSRWMFSANVVVPVAAPPGYSIGGTFNLNYFY